jgi:hypothetical protein
MKEVEMLKPWHILVGSLVLAETIVVVGLAIRQSRMDVQQECTCLPSRSQPVILKPAEVQPAPPVEVPAPVVVKPAPTGHMVLEVRGTSNKNTDTFYLVDAQTALLYDVKCGNQFCLFHATLRSPGGRSYDRTTLVMISQSSKDLTRIYKPAGEYYLDIDAINCSWSVGVAQAY